MQLRIQTDAERHKALINVQRERGRRSLAQFVRYAWSVIEPNELRWTWHMDAVCAHLEAVTRGEIRDLVICIPPGMSKSLLVSTFWPAWDWIQQPTRRLISATYGQDLSDKNAKLHRDLILSDWFQERWPEIRIGVAESKRVRLFQNTSKGWRFSTSTAGEVTGRHADILLFDDLVKAQDASGKAAIEAGAIEKANDFWFKTMATRRADAATTRKVGIAQRLHHEDTPGKCIELGYTALVLPMEHDEARVCRTTVKWSAPKRNADGVLEVPERLSDRNPPTPFQDPREVSGELLAPARFPREVVDHDKSVEGLGPIVHEAQNQQDPTPQEGVIFKDIGHLRYEEIPAGARYIMTVDCAFKDTAKSDFVALQVWAVKTPHYYLVDEIHGRGKVAWTCEAIRELQGLHPKVIGIYVEDKANGPAVLEALQGEISGVQEWSPGTDSKVSRAEAVAPLFAKNVWLPTDANAPWIGKYLTELRRFPLTKNDDRVDATSMALLILHKPMVRLYADAVRRMRGRS